MNKNTKLPQWAEWLLWGFAALLALRYLIPALFKATGIGKLFLETKADVVGDAIKVEIKNNPAPYVTPAGNQMSAADIDRDAKLIRKFFRLPKDPGNWDTWVEDDEQAAGVLAVHNKSSFALLEAKYNSLYGADLKKDILKYLDTSLYKKLPLLW